MGKKKTHGEFVEELKKNNKHFNDIELLSEYTGVKNKISCRCKKCGYRWTTVAESLKMGCGCKLCGRERTKNLQIRPLDSFLDALHVKRDDIEYVCGYKSMKSVATFRCKKHNELFKTTPLNALGGVTCRLCREEKPQYNKLTKEQINQSLLPLKIELAGEYINSKAPTTFRCQLCGETFVSKYELVKYWTSVGCNHCGGRINPTEKNKTVNRKIAKLYSHKSKNVEILKYDEKFQEVKCRCLMCGAEYETSYASLVQGCMHKNCASIIGSSKSRLSNDEVIKRIESFGNNIKVDFSNYLTANSLLNCECMDCGHKWLAKQKNLIRGRGCPVCAQKNRDVSKYKSLDDYADLLKKMNLNVISQYINATTPVDIKCATCGKVFKSSMAYLSQALVGCTDCSKERYRVAKFGEFVSKLSHINPKIKLTDNYVNMSTLNDFVCTECGGVFKRTPHDMLRNCNCPNCTTNSKMEYLIKLYLDKHNIEYDLHRSFDGLCGVNGGSLSYDFYLPYYNTLIEAQGEQHEHPIDYFGGEKSFAVQQEHDNRKRKFAQDNNIELLEVWYYECDNIKQILQKKLISKI